MFMENNQFTDINDFEFIERIGSGSFGEVYKVRHKGTNCLYAAKTLFKSVDISSETISPDYLNLIREVNNMSKIDHPSIIKLHGFSPVNIHGEPKPVIILEYAENKSLANIIEKESRGLSLDFWDSTTKLFCLYSIANGMMCLESYNIIHRDLKPSNILIDFEGKPKISDFGTSKMIHSNLNSLTFQSKKDLKGTIAYIAPEIFRNFEYSTKSDVYAFGMLMLEVMSSEEPYKNIKSHQIPNDVMNGVRPEINKSIPEAYRNMIERCLRDDPNERPSFKQIEDELRNNPDFRTETFEEGIFDPLLDYIDKYPVIFMPENQVIDNSSLIKKQDDVKTTTKTENKPILNILKIFKHENKPKKIYPDELYGSLDEDCQNMVKHALLNPEMQFIVGKSLIEGINNFPINIDIGVKYLENSISHSNADSAVYLARLLIKGDLIKRNFCLAENILSKFLKNEDDRIDFLYGKLMNKQNKYSKALKYFQKGAKNGNNDSMYEYAKLLFTGFGGKQDAISAIDMLKSARDRKNEKCKTFLEFYNSFCYFHEFTNLPLEVQYLFISNIVKKVIHHAENDNEKLQIIIKPKYLKVLISINQSNISDFISIFQKPGKVQFCVNYKTRNNDILKKIEYIKKQMQSAEILLMISEIEKLERLEGISSLYDTIIIDDTVKRISNAAFNSLENVTKIILPQSITEIAESLFNGCTSIKQIEIPNSVNKIKVKAFKNCTSLEQITIPESVKAIEASTFENCISLKQIKLPQSITSIGISAFENCTSLVKIVLPECINTINHNAFTNCSNLMQIEIPSMANNIGENVFNGCNSLIKITILSSIKSLGYSLFKNCISLSKFTIPKSVTSIGISVFENCSSLNQVTIPDSVVSIDHHAFYKCSKLVQIKIPSSVKSIENNTFEDCTSLNQIIIPSSVNYLGYNVFKNCIKLEQVTLNSIPSSIKSNTFDNCPSLFKIIGSKNILEKFKQIGNDAENYDKNKAFAYYKMAAESGEIECMSKCAKMIKNADGISMNMSEAVKYFKMSAENGSIESMEISGEMFIKGDGIADNMFEAAKYYKMAAQKGSVIGIYNYAIMLRSGKGVPINKREALQYFIKAANLNHTDAMNKCGYMLGKGDGVDINKAEACKYYKMGADGGNAKAMYNYAFMLENGEGVLKNKAEACKYYKMSAECGDTKGMINYGRMLENGEGVKKNKSKAFEYYKMAADGGNTNGMVYCGRMLEKGDGVEKNVAEACELYKKAAVNGNPCGMYYYAEMLQYGRGISKNIDEACIYYKKVKNKGGRFASKASAALNAINNKQ